jgi:urease subunit alpha
MYRPMFGAHVSVIASTCVTFVSGSSLEHGIADQLGLRRRLDAVQACRSIGKRDMVRNDALPRIEVNPETYEVRVDGELATVPPAETLPLSQRYFIV